MAPGSSGEMQAVILAGGLGTRMRPTTETIPKPLIAVAGKPFLQHQMELLRLNGVRRHLLLVAYLGEQIENYFGDGAAVDCAIEYSYEPTLLGTGGALKNAEGKLNDWFFLVNGDTYLSIDYARVAAEFRQTKCSAFVVAYEKPETPSAEVPASALPGNLNLRNDGLVLAYEKRSSDNWRYIDAGVLALNKDVLRLMAAGQKCSLEEEIFPRLIEGGEMRAWITREPFFDMGGPAGLAALEKKLA